MKNQSAEVVVVIGSGLIGQAIARRVGTGKHVLLSDLRQQNCEAAAKALSDADPQGATTGAQHVVRGGSWHQTATSWRSSFRKGYAPDYRGISIGFRLIMIEDKLK